MNFRETAAPQDWTSIAVHLASHGLRLGANRQQFAGGLANLNYRIELDGRPAVFRRPPSGDLAHGASDMVREAKILSALAPHFPLAPALLHLCTDLSVIGVPFQLLEFRSGVAIGGTLPPDLGAENAPWMLAALATSLAALHALEPSAIGLQELGRPTGFAARQLRGWTKRADAAFAAERPPALDALLDRLSRGVPPDSPVSLLHMDPKFDNLLLLPAERRASALIDWDMGTLGPPAFDLAVLLSYWIESSDPAGVHPLAALPSLVPGWPRRSDVMAAYGRAAGMLPADLGWYLALARLRLATAWMQLYRLWQQGGLSGERYGGFAPLAAAILGHALDQFGDTA
jgi:aminoglycoside phosphotransferase (APT) family kinase protein